MKQIWSLIAAAALAMEAPSSFCASGMVSRKRHSAVRSRSVLAKIASVTANTAVGPAPTMKVPLLVPKTFPATS